MIQSMNVATVLIAVIKLMMVVTEECVVMIVGK